MVGTANKPRCFSNTDLNDLLFEYENLRKGWMNGSIFGRWLLRIDEYIGRTSGRKALLFIDNTSAHGKIFQHYAT